MPKQNLPKLERSQWEYLDCQYQDTPSPEDGQAASGEHYKLMHVLNKLGYYPNGRDDAFALAERLLSNGYTELDQ